MIVRDQHGNSTVISDDEPDSAIRDIYFTVDSAIIDTTPPVVTSVSLNSPGPFSPGETVQIAVNVEDDSLITSASLDFKIVGNDNYNQLHARMESYNNGVVYISLELPETIPAAMFKAYSLIVRDQHGNSTVVSDDEPGSVIRDVYFITARTDIPVTGINIPETGVVRVRDVYTITPDVEPITSIPQWTWTSSDIAIAEVHSADSFRYAYVTGVAPGTATITGTTSNGLTASCVVTVVDAPMPTGGSVEDSYQVDIGEELDIAPVLVPSNATTLYEISTDNPHVVGVNTTNGHTGVSIRGINAGTANITVRGSNNLVMTTTVTVGDPEDRQHQKVTIPAIPATCISTGRSEYIKCSACEHQFTSPEVLPRTDHTYGDWRVVSEATATQSGLKVRYCTVCYTSEEESIPATGNSEDSTGGEQDDSGSTGGSQDNSTTKPLTETEIENTGISATISKDTVEIMVSQSQINTIIDSAENGTVYLDFSHTEDVTSVSVPQNLVSAIHGTSAVSDVTIDTAYGSMNISQEALSTIFGFMTGENDTVKLELNNIDISDISASQRFPIAEVMNNAVFVNLSATIEHRNESGNIIESTTLHEFNGNISISIPYTQPENVTGRQIIACYFADDGSLTYFPVKYENNMATFVTTHYSKFGIYSSLAATFRDIDMNSWYMPSVEFTLEKNFMNGVENDLFSPNTDLSRAMLVQILYRMNNSPSVNGNVKYSDVEDGKWYSDAICWATENNIVIGYDDGSFRPNASITRQELVSVLYRYLGCPDMQTVEVTFRDFSDVSEWALDAINWAIGANIVSGYGDGTLDPMGSTTRAQVTAILMRVFG